MWLQVTMKMIDNDTDEDNYKKKTDFKWRRQWWWCKWQNVNKLEWSERVYNNYYNNDNNTFVLVYSFSRMYIYNSELNKYCIVYERHVYPVFTYLMKVITIRIIKW